MRFRGLLAALTLTIFSLTFLVNASFIEGRAKPFHPAIQDFRDLIESDPEIFVGFSLMFDQVPNTTTYQVDPTGLRPQIRNYHTMLTRLNQILTTAPIYGDLYIPFPIATIFTWPMCTQAGFDMFMNPKVNAKLRRILNTWAEFLSTPDSRSTLTKGPGGWLNETLIANFTNVYECNSHEEYYGFRSWDDFFTRKFREGVRPVDAAEDVNVINNACESLPYRISQNVKEKDTFWMKDEPYSLRHMLNDDHRVAQFINGTVIQSVLAGYNYHRWHSPVDGTIVKVESVPGTYYAISPAWGFGATSHPDPVKDGHSQAFMTNVATRLIIFIRADNPEIGLMAFIAVGMGEISSCQATVKKGDRVKKGDQLGMFHYGGSTYCMVFRPETRIEFTEEVQNAVRNGSFSSSRTVLLNERIGVVQST